MGGAPSIAFSMEPVLLDSDPCQPNNLCVPNNKYEPTKTYEIGYKIGEGSFATVRLCTSIKTKQKVAIKEVLTTDLDEGQLQELTMEMTVLSQLRHPNIVLLLEVYTMPQATYLVTEYLQGGELFDAICEQEYYKEVDARRVMKSVISALEYMHKHQVVHRDMKPENLILIDNTHETDLKLIDFGFATIISPGQPLPTQLCGTPGYISPEMIKGIPHSFSVDVWSSGVILYVLLSGMPPFIGNSKDELFDLIQNGRYSYPEAYWSNVSDAAKDLIDRMLTVDPVKRITMKGVMNHPWMNDQTLHTRDLSKNLDQMREWNASRQLKLSALAIKSAVRFTLAGKKYRSGFLKAAKNAADLDAKGISWELSKEEISSALMNLEANKQSDGVGSSSSVDDKNRPHRDTDISLDMSPINSLRKS